MPVDRKRELIINGTVFKYTNDSGSTSTLFSLSMAKEAGLVVRRYPEKVRIDLAISGHEGFLVGETTTNMTLKTICGDVNLRNVACVITEDEIDEVLLGDDVLRGLGINVDQLVDSLAGKTVDLQEPGVESDNKEPLDFGENDETEIRSLLKKLVSDSEKRGLPSDYKAQLDELLQHYADVWRIKLGNDPPAKVAPMEVTYDTTVEPIKLRNRKYPLKHREFLDYHCRMLEEYGLAFENPRARFVSPALVVPKVSVPDDIRTDFRFTVDSREANKISDTYQWPMPLMEQVQEHLHGAKYFIALDLKDGYWQCPLAKSCQELFSFCTHDKVYTPVRVIQGAKGAVMYFQRTMQHIFKKELYKSIIVWLDDLLLYAENIDKLYRSLRYVLEVCRNVGFKLAVKKCILFAKELKWCGKIHTPKGIKQDPDRIKGLVELPPPKDAEGLMTFIFASNWIRSAIPDFGRIVLPLQIKLDAALKGLPSRTKKRARRVALAWTAEDLVHFEAVKSSIARSVMQCHPNQTWDLVLMTDASDKGWAIVLLQCQRYKRDLPISEHAFEPLFFLSGTFRDSSSKWAINEKEAFPIIEALGRLRHLLLRPKGFYILCDHRNLVYMFSEQPGQKLPTRAKLTRWAMELQGFNYRIEHVAGEQNLWADILSRWIPNPSTFAAKRIVRGPRKSEQCLRNPMEALEWPTLDDISRVQRSCNEKKPLNLVYRDNALRYTDNLVWIPESGSLRVRLMTIAHYGYYSHRGV